MSEPTQDAQNEDFFGDFTNATATNNSTHNITHNDHSNNDNPSESSHNKIGEPTEAQASDVNNEHTTHQSSATPGATSGDAPSTDFSLPTNGDNTTSTTNTASRDLEFDFSDFKASNGTASTATTSDLNGIDFGSFSTEPAQPVPVINVTGTSAAETQLSEPTDTTSEASNEGKSDTDSTAPMDAWSVSTQYPDSRADSESVRDDVKSEQSLDDKSQVASEVSDGDDRKEGSTAAEDASDGFDFPTPKETESVTGSQDNASEPRASAADSLEFDFPTPTTRSNEPEQVPGEQGVSGQAEGTHDAKPDEAPTTEVLVAPVLVSEDKTDVNDETVSSSSDTPATNTNDFTFEDEFKTAPVPTAIGTNDNGSQATSDASENKSDQALDTPLDQSGTDETEKKDELALVAQQNNDFFAAPDEPSAEQKPLQGPETTTQQVASNHNGFEFEAEFASSPTPATNVEHNTQPETPAATNTEHGIQLEAPETLAESPVQASNNNDFEFEAEFTAAPASETTEGKEETVTEKPVDESTQVKETNDFEFEGEFTAAPSVPVTGDTAHSDDKKDDSPVKEDNDFEFEAEFSSAPPVPAAANNTATVENKDDDEDDFFGGEFQAAPTTQPQAAPTSGTFEADFDEDFEGFAQAPTVTQPPVQPPQPVVAQAPTPWLFDGSETEVHQHVQALVSKLFPAPAVSKALPDINVTVEERLEEVMQSAPESEAQTDALPASSVFADQLKALLAAVGPSTSSSVFQPARARPKRTSFDSPISKKEILSVLKKETSAVLHVSPRPTLPSARGKKKKANQLPQNTSSAAVKQPSLQPPKVAASAQPPKIGQALPPSNARPPPTQAKTPVQTPVQPKPNETPEEKSARIVNDLLQSVPDLSFMLLEEFRPPVNVAM